MNASLERVNFKSIGQPVRRKEDDRLIRGEGRFSDDFNLPGQVYAAVVRSIYPHAHIRDIDEFESPHTSCVNNIFLRRVNLRIQQFSQPEKA